MIHKRNAGVSAARNTGIEACTRDDICFVDGDDYVIPDYVRKLFLYNEVERTSIQGCSYT